MKEIRWITNEWSVKWELEVITKRSSSKNYIELSPYCWHWKVISLVFDSVKNSCLICAQIRTFFLLYFESFPNFFFTYFSGSREKCWCSSSSRPDRYFVDFARFSNSVNKLWFVSSWLRFKCELASIPDWWFGRKDKPNTAKGNVRSFIRNNCLSK